ncbi:hypothetical protein NPIL_163771 [Nephila pilipes]|uniref:Uncharacterized protein n=1 Tax=Nephila pilipes TaxID=299642 RepID=A0A8X6T366_NEPPI|nr:hypothetical protein NPIL_163771 [Nephila pilipes]
MARTKRNPSGVKLARASDSCSNDIDNRAEEDNTEPVKMIDASVTDPDDFPSKPEPLSHCRNLQLIVEEYAHTLKGICQNRRADQACPIISVSVWNTRCGKSTK